jgi:circadian clock protein KaiB
MTKPHDATLTRLEDLPDPNDRTWYELTLVVSGASDLSTRAIANARRLCDTYMKDRYHLSVVDLHEQPAGALDRPVLAAPTLIKDLPLPSRKFVGDLSHTDKALLALGLPGATDTPAPTC